MMNSDTGLEMDAIVVDDLRVVRGGREVLPGLSLRVPRGAVVGLLGPSGCGKSTLMRSIVGVQRTLRRHPQGAVVAVQVRGRPWAAVVADMIEGVVVANRLQPPAADRLRTELWSAIGLEWPADLGKVA